MTTPADPNQSRQRAGVRRTVAILVVLAAAAYGMFLWTATRGGA